MRLTYVLMLGAAVASTCVCMPPTAKISKGAEIRAICPENCRCYASTQDANFVQATCADLPLRSETSYDAIRALTVVKGKDPTSCYVPGDLAAAFPNVNYVSLANCSLTSVARDAFSDMTLLEEVDLSRNLLKKLHAAAFAFNPKLKYVNLEGNPLKLRAKPFVVSRSIFELNLSSCNLTKIPLNSFKGLPNLRDANLGGNKLKTLQPQSLPKSLSKLNLSGNDIAEVPTTALIGLKRLKELDLTGNPIACSCELIGFQNWVTGTGMYVKGLKCATPPKFKDKYLSDVGYELCDDVDTPASSSECVGLTCNNRILPDEEGYQGDAPQQDVDPMYADENLLPVQKRDSKSEEERDMVREDPNNMEVEGSGYESPEKGEKKEKREEKEKKELEGSGDDEEEAVSLPKGTTTEEGITKVNDILKFVTDQKEDKATTFEDKTDEPDPTPSTGTTEYVPEKFVEPIVTSESSSTQETSSSSSSPATLPSTEMTPFSEAPLPETHSSSATSETSDVVVDQTTMPVLIENSTVLTGGSANARGFLANSNGTVGLEDGTRQSLIYIVPTVMVLFIVLICLGVYATQKYSLFKRSWKPSDPVEDGNENDPPATEMKLLNSDELKAKIDARCNRYPEEAGSEQTEKLMNGDRRDGANGGFEKLPNGTGNGNGGGGVNIPCDDSSFPVECTVAKVTTLPDSLPRTPVIIRKL